MHLVATPSWYLAVYCDGSSFTPAPSTIWVASHLSTGKHHNNFTRHEAHMYLHHTSTTIHFFFLYIFHFPGQADCPPLVPSATLCHVPALSTTKTFKFAKASGDLRNFSLPIGPYISWICTELFFKKRPESKKDIDKCLKGLSHEIEMG
jgi:hypothetical protein